jgi:hypothetical protein
VLLISSAGLALFAQRRARGSPDSWQGYGTVASW